jgi:hypothetical protein
MSSSSTFPDDAPGFAAVAVLPARKRSECKSGVDKSVCAYLFSGWNAQSRGTFSLSSIQVGARAPRIEYIHIVGRGQVRRTNLYS